MKIEFAEKCAWRAAYLFNGKGKQIAHFGIDPDHAGPRLFGAVIGFSWNLRIPTVGFNTAYNHRWLMPLYRIQGRILSGLDGRYGWGMRP